MTQRSLRTWPLPSQRRFLSLAVVALYGCSVSQPARLSSSAVVDGTDNRDEAVLFVLGLDGVRGTPATGTLVAPDLILTCRHCVQENPGGVVASCTIPFPATSTWQMQAYEGAALSNAQLSTPSEVIGTALFPPGTHTACDGDIALIRLNRVMTTRPLELATNAPTIGDPVGVVGYGKVVPRQTSPDPRRRLEGVGEIEPLAGARTFPTFQTNARACEGDSGGPIFDAEGRILGVVSRTASLDCQRTFGIALGPFRGWLDEQISASYARNPGSSRAQPRTQRLPSQDGSIATEDAAVADGGTMNTPAVAATAGSGCSVRRSRTPEAMWGLMAAVTGLVMWRRWGFRAA